MSLVFDDIPSELITMFVLMPCSTNPAIWIKCLTYNTVLPVLHDSRGHLSDPLISQSL